MSRFHPGIALSSVALALLIAFPIDNSILIATAQTSKTSSRSQSKVEVLYNTNCARCHGPDGKGDTPAGVTFNTPDLTDPSWWRQNASISSTKSFRSIITNGKSGMPAFGKKLTKSEINLLADRMRRFRK
jgi:mono/diheme cytochrome c family protein